MSESTEPLVVMFADISGSTRLYDYYGDQRALAWVNECLHRLREITAQAGGHTVRSTGDGLLCTFVHADAALEAGAWMIEVIAGIAGPPGLTLVLHVGCHYGPVIESEGDIYGDTVNLAARVAGLARPGQIMTTEATVAQLSAGLRERVRGLGPMPVKGKQDPPLIYEYVPAEPGEATQLRTRFDLHAPGRMRLRHGGKEWSLAAGGRTRYTLGRDASCDVVVTHPRASRHHAHLELRGNHYHLVDHSSNGTHVVTASGETLVLRHQEMVLTGRGQIALGQAPDQREALPIEYAVEHA
jgi:class 3 adenylate cyclase